MKQRKLSKTQKIMLSFIESSDDIKIKVDSNRKRAIVITDHECDNLSIYASSNSNKILRWSTFYKLILLGYVEANGDTIDGYPVFSSKSKERDKLVIAKNDIHRILVIMRVEGINACFRIRSVAQFLVRGEKAYAHSATHAFRYLKRMEYIQEKETIDGWRWFLS